MPPAARTERGAGATDGGGVSVEDRAAALKRDLGQDEMLQLACQCLKLAVQGGFDKRRLKALVWGAALGDEARKKLLEAMLAQGDTTKLTKREAEMVSDVVK